MADIVAIAGRRGVLLVNGVTVRLTRITVNITNAVIKFATTGQTADADSNHWMNALSGINDYNIEADGYVDHNATPGLRLIGDGIKFRPGTGAAGVVSVALFTSHGFTGSVIVESITPSLDAESQKPQTFRVRLQGDGAITYVNA